MVSPTAEELYSKSMKRREELLLEIEALSNFIASYERLFALKSAAARTQADEPNLFGPTSRRAARAERIAEMVEAARKTVIAAQRPMKRGELREKVEQLGFEMVGTDKNKVFGTNLWRSKKFKMIDGQGYWPTDVELPSESRNRQQ